MFLLVRNGIFVLIFIICFKISHLLICGVFSFVFICEYIIIGLEVLIIESDDLLVNTVWFCL